MRYFTFNPYLATSPTAFAAAVCTLGLFAKAILTPWLLSPDRSEAKKFTYVGVDYPQEWSIERPPVRIAFGNSVRFDLATASGVAEWAAIVPGDGLVYLGEHGQPFTVSIMHQLRCLQILRKELVEDTISPTESLLTRHCLNYLKQMVLCRGDIQLEPFQYPNNKDPINLDGVYECRDWGVVYAEVRENQRKHAGATAALV